MSEKYISLDNLKEYNKTMKETYIQPLEDKVNTIPQADWNQNDEAAADYIKNRPFYTTSLQIIDGSYTSRNDIGAYIFMGNYINAIQLESLPTKVKLIFNGVDYGILQCIPMENEMVGVGNMAKASLLFGGEYEDTGEPFGFALLKDMFYLITDELYESTSCDMSMSIPNMGIVKLDERYLPDETWVQPDWNQSQPNAKDYIRNKPKVNNSYDANSTNAQSGVAVAEALEPLKKTITKLEETAKEVTVVTFNITEDDIVNGTNSITLQDLIGVTKINWGDGTINNELRHTYAESGEYICKIFNITTIGREAFSGCDNLTGIQIGSDVTEILYAAFFRCNNLTNIIIPDNITLVGGTAFRGSSNLSQVTLSKSLTDIHACSFVDCTSLEKIVIPENIQSIWSEAFYGSGLKEITIPANVTFISDNAFSYCNSLTKVIIEKSDLNKSVFSNCPALTEVIFKNSAPITYKVDNPWFEGCTSLTNIYVPYGCGDAYRTKWAADGATEDILSKIVESDREAMMSDLNSGLDEKFDKAGGLIGGDLLVQGNLSVSGTTTTKDTETIMVKDNTIVTNSDGIELVDEAGFVIKTDETNAYGIMYDPVGDGVKIGLGSFDENGRFIYTEGEDQFLATRADTIVDGNLVNWNNVEKTFVDTGKNIEDFVMRDKASSNGVYGKSAGNEILYSVSQWGAGGGEDSIARRTNKGGLRVFLDETNANPEEMATPRGYVDSFIPKLLPDVDDTANGKILQVVDGAWTVTKPTVIYVGTAEPTSETGEDGDLYLQTD